MPEKAVSELTHWTGLAGFDVVGPVRALGGHEAADVRVALLDSDRPHLPKTPRVRGRPACLTPSGQRSADAAAACRDFRHVGWTTIKTGEKLLQPGPKCNRTAKAKTSAARSYTHGIPKRNLVPQHWASHLMRCEAAQEALIHILGRASGVSNKDAVGLVKHGCAARAQLLQYNFSFAILILFNYVV
jgi:hypothetical protein